MKLITNLAIIMSFFTFGKANSQTSKKFKDKPNTAVFSTKFVITENKEITYVSHDLDDGAWQFFSNDEFESFEKVAMIVSLEQIIKRDATLLEIADLPQGYYATRKSKKSKWQIYKQK